ncbi:hypothetical protein [Bradyrhizobium sp. CSS354]|uniref:hypothetical protein n=1 Tax=Bradyrhizobium sp. CSS354 TaxID=2699172 RepID=UPI0023B1C443|nr:hypothetical protein [Bradyrhizobium sp. CSS354]MDE5463315.1 hypothetical protein [Bradyrhizobium sp. CSS354]
MTLAKVDAKFEGGRLETMLSENTKKAIGVAVGNPKPSKKEIGWYLAELCANPQAVNPFDDETRRNLTKILKFAADKFAAGG